MEFFGCAFLHTLVTVSNLANECGLTRGCLDVHQRL